MEDNDLAKNLFFWSVAGSRNGDVQPFLTGGAKPDLRVDGKPVIVWAAEAGNCDAVKKLLQANAKINDTAPNGETALTAAIRNGREECVRLLCEKGANKEIGPGKFNAYTLALKLHPTFVSILNQSSLVPSPPVRRLSLMSACRNIIAGFLSKPEIKRAPDPQ